MGKQSAGILLYKKANQRVQIFLVHPGGPFFKNKNLGVWSIPKGELLANEDPLVAAKREFREETGTAIEGNFVPLNPVILKSGKKVFAWAVEGDLNEKTIFSNLFEVEWPPKSGKQQSFPEIDRAGWFDVEEALLKINGAQANFISELILMQKV